MITDILLFPSFLALYVDMIFKNIISTCQDMLCVEINVDKRYIDHGPTFQSHWQAWGNDMDIYQSYVAKESLTVSSCLMLSPFKTQLSFTM